MAKRFSATEATTKRDLKNTMDKIGATSLKISTDEFTGEVEVVFDRPGRRYRKACNRWDRPLDNLRAIGLSIDYLYRAVEAYGVKSQEEILSKMLDEMLISLEAAPNDTVLLLSTGATDWWEILGVNKQATKSEVINAFRALSRVHHPDVGGSSEDFVRIRRAYEQAIDAIG